MENGVLKFYTDTEKSISAIAKATKAQVETVEFQKRALKN
jgi:hypothetical protein